LSHLLSTVPVTSCGFYFKRSMCPPAAERRTLKMCCYRSRVVSTVALKKHWHFTR